MFIKYKAPMYYSFREIEIGKNLDNENGWNTYALNDHIDYNFDEIPDTNKESIISFDVSKIKGKYYIGFMSDGGFDIYEMWLE